MTVKNTWSLRNVYLYVVCLITLVMVIFASVSFVRAVVGLIYPDPGYYNLMPRSIDGTSDYDPADLERAQQNQRDQSMRQVVLSLVGNGAMLLLAGPLYVYHWRKIEREVAPPSSAA
ncbi:MAG: hypothetical protein ACYC5O_14240 [Anaerolineae bacterium]